jgi:hypothetical protein
MVAPASAPVRRRHRIIPRRCIQSLPLSSPRYMGDVLVQRSVMKLAPFAVSTLLVLAVHYAEAQTTPQPGQPATPQAVPPAASAPPAAAAPPATATPPASDTSSATPTAGTPTTAPTTPGTGEPSIVYTTVNLREGPGTSYSVVAKIPAGSTINVGSCTGQFCQASWQGKDGYVIATSLVKRSAAPGYGSPPPGYAPPADYAGPPVYYGYGPGPYCCGYYGPYGHRGWRHYW